MLKVEQKEHSNIKNYKDRNNNIVKHLNHILE